MIEVVISVVITIGVLFAYFWFNKKPKDPRNIRTCEHSLQVCTHFENDLIRYVVEQDIEMEKVVLLINESRIWHNRLCDSVSLPEYKLPLMSLEPARGNADET